MLLHLTGTAATEKDLERKVIKYLRQRGVLAYKFVSPSCKGVPDDLILCAGGVACFIEFKSPAGSGRLSPLQKRQIEKLREKGFKVFVVDSMQSGDEAITDILALHNKTVDRGK